MNQRCGKQIFFKKKSQPPIAFTFVNRAFALYGSTVWLTAFLRKAVLATDRVHFSERDLKRNVVAA